MKKNRIKRKIFRCCCELRHNDIIYYFNYDNTSPSLSFWMDREAFVKEFRKIENTTDVIDKAREAFTYLLNDAFKNINIDTFRFSVWGCRIGLRNLAITFKLLEENNLELTDEEEDEIETIILKRQ